MAEKYNGEKITICRGDRWDSDYIAVYKDDKLIHWYHQGSLVEMLHRIGLPVERIILDEDGELDDDFSPPESLKECKRMLKERRLEVLEDRAEKLDKESAELEAEIVKLKTELQ